MTRALNVRYDGTTQGTTTNEVDEGFETTFTNTLNVSGGINRGSGGRILDSRLGIVNKELGETLVENGSTLVLQKSQTKGTSNVPKVGAAESHILEILKNFFCRDVTGEDGSKAHSVVVASCSTVRDESNDCGEAVKKYQAYKVAVGGSDSNIVSGVGATSTEKIEIGPERGKELVSVTHATKL